MASENTSKLNRLYQRVPEGWLVDAAWLEANGYSHSLRQKYLAHGWLLPLARGVFRRPAARLFVANAEEGALPWELVVLSLQHLMKVGVSVGGRTALELQGFAHYLPAAGRREVHLYASKRLPGWLSKLPATAAWAVHYPDRLLVSPGRGLDSVCSGYQPWPLTLSTPERAILELIDELPRRESFEQVDALMSGLATLSPRRLQRVLEDCRSVKTKRLFFVLAERHNHAWLKQLDRDRINLGSGKRALVEGGRLHPKYQITVPDSLLKEGNDF